MVSRRSNEEWLSDLRGESGVEAQSRALQDLGNYLYIVNYNYLYRHQATISLLQNWNTDELAELAQDCAQDTLIKIANDNFALLCRFSDRGRFTSWAAVVAQRVTSSTVRLAHFNRVQSNLEKVTSLSPSKFAPSTQISQQEVIDELQDCINRLSKIRSRVLVECILHERRSRDVAIEMDRSENAINLQVLHAKRQVRLCMESKGLGIDVLTYFE